jgi:hypothetical protein
MNNLGVNYHWSDRCNNESYSKQCFVVVVVEGGRRRGGGGEER